MQSVAILAQVSHRRCPGTGWLGAYSKGLCQKHNSVRPLCRAALVFGRPTAFRYSFSFARDAEGPTRPPIAEMVPVFAKGNAGMGMEMSQVRKDNVRHGQTRPTGGSLRMVPVPLQERQRGDAASTADLRRHRNSSQALESRQQKSSSFPCPPPAQKARGRINSASSSSFSRQQVSITRS